MRTYANPANIDLPLAVFLAHDSYVKAFSDQESYSVTTLLKPIRKTILASRIQQGQENLVDIRLNLPSRIGQAIHLGLELAWTTGADRALEALGVPRKVRESIKVNPDPATLQPGDMPIYTEQRSHREVNGAIIHGQFDLVWMGEVQDLKTTTTFLYRNDTNTESYRKQGSVYRWLNPGIVTKDTMTVHYILKDWSATRALNDPSYPASPTFSKQIPLMTLPETEAWVRSQVETLRRNWNVPEPQLPKCSDQDLWRSDPQFKYYSNASNTRATKNFDSLAEAQLYMLEKGGKGVIKEVMGEVRACATCPCFSLCTQKDAYLISGELKV